MAELVLYNYFRSSTSYRVRIALHYKNIEFKYEPVHLLNNGGEQNKADYKTLNPMSEVPTLVHEGMPLSQSMAIIEYLDEMFTSHRLFPQDAQKKARVRQFCENINSFTHPLTNLKVLQYLETKHGYTPSDKEIWSQHWLKKGFEAFEKTLKKTHGHYCFGDQITAADLFLIPQVFSAKRFKFSVEEYPLINQINNRALAHEAFIKAHPLRQIDTPAEEKI